MSNVDRAGEVIEGYFPTCDKCRGFPEVGECPNCSEMCMKIARALSAAGLITPDLPEYDPQQWGEFIWNPTKPGSDTWSVEESGGHVNAVGVDWLEMTPDEAVELALALLAAARHARNIKETHDA